MADCNENEQKNGQKSENKPQKEVIVFPAMRWEAFEWDGIVFPATYIPESVVELPPWEESDLKWEDLPPWEDLHLADNATITTTTTTIHYKNSESAEDVPPSVNNNENTGDQDPK